MKNQRINPGVIWKQFEDVLVPRLRLTVIDRAVYSYLFRHSHLEGKRQVRFTILSVARAIRLSIASARQSVRRLIERGVFRLVERSTAGHVVEVRLPHEIPAARSGPVGTSNAAQPDGAIALEDVDFMQTKALRHAIHARERGRCFYCLRRTKPRMLCLDHIVPRAELGCNSYRNLASCCQECNARKGDSAAGNFLRWLYREGRLTSAELSARLRALHALAAGKLRPAIQSQRSYEGKELNETRRLGRTRAADLFSPMDHEAAMCPDPDGPGQPLAEKKSPPEEIGRA